MPLIFDINELKLLVDSFVLSGKNDDFIISKLEEKLVSKKQMEELMLHAYYFRNEIEYNKVKEKEEDKRTNKGLLVFWALVIVVTVLVMLITKNDNTIIGGGILAVSLHQIIMEGIKYSRY